MMYMHTITKYKNLALLISIFVIALFLRFYSLNEIPAEMWGDIVEGYLFTKEILKGTWPFYFVLGNGPLFFYIAAAFSTFFGLSFYTLKLTSIFAGFLLMIGSYLIAKEIAGTKVALLTAFLISVSKWSLIQSRIGNMNILVAASVSLIFYFLIRAIKTGKWVYFVLLGIFTGVGMYNYPAFLFVPITLFLIFLTLLIFERKTIMHNFMKIILAVAVYLILCIPFYNMRSQFGFTSSKTYFGSKIFVEDGRLPSDFMNRFWENFKSSMGMFHIRGDSIFRGNPRNEPHLDRISGFFLLLGLFFFIKRKELKRYTMYILFPLFSLQLPAMLVLNFPGEVPSAVRTVGILPFLYIVIALGIYYLTRLCKGYLRTVVLVILLSFITYLNYESVFTYYPKGLPNNNTPFGKIIAREIDKLPAGTKIYIDGCCWGDWGQPEPGGIIYVMKTKRPVKFFAAHDNLRDFSCGENPRLKEDTSAYYVINPKLPNEMKKIKDCIPGGVEGAITVNGFNVAKLYTIGL